MNIFDLSLNELIDYVVSAGFEKYRAEQILTAAYKNKPLESSGIPRALFVLLKEKFILQPCEIIKSVKSADGTEKYLLRLFDGELIECVLLKQDYGKTLCISTQVGCSMKCAFCASGENGLVRHLSAGEMSAQVVLINNCAGAVKKDERSITNIVLMGSGEPLHNYDNTLKFLRNITDEKSLNFSPRNISLSTCGLVEKILKFCGEGIAVTLSLSLHSPFDSVRRRIMPVAKTYRVKETIDAVKRYFEKTGRRVVIEYSLIDGLNNRDEDAAELKKLLKGFSCHINLIRLNAVKGSEFAPPTEANAKEFCEKLVSLGLSATIRKSKGGDIEGACGQLRVKFTESK